MRRFPVWAVWALGALPLALLLWDMAAGRLGIDPVREIEHRLGRTALYLLIATLAVTPLLRWMRISLIRQRRALGLICFCYAALHVAAWTVIDMGLRWDVLLRDVIQRPYLVLGMAGFAILAVLAATSNDASVRRLGPAWRRLHRLSHVAALLAAAHWIWSQKLWEPKPLMILALILVILALRHLAPAVSPVSGWNRREN